MKKIDKEKIKSTTIGIIIGIIPIILVMAGLWYVSCNVAWNVEYGQFVRSEVHSERVLNVTWILLDDGELMYGTYNPEVLDLIPGEYYWFGEGLISGNFGKRLLWVSDENPYC